MVIVQMTWLRQTNGVRYPLVGGTRQSHSDGTGLSIVYSFFARRAPSVGAPRFELGTSRNGTYI